MAIIGELMLDSDGYVLQRLGNNRRLDKYSEEGVYEIYSGSMKEKVWPFDK